MRCWQQQKGSSRDTSDTAAGAKTTLTTNPNPNPNPSPSPNPNPSPTPNLDPDPNPNFNRDRNPSPDPNPKPDPNQVDGLQLHLAPTSASGYRGVEKRPNGRFKARPYLAYISATSRLYLACISPRCKRCAELAPFCKGLAAKMVDGAAF